ncbi:MAG: hypothetical protein AVDCRST_MAG26-534 [uncultured Chloroflexia bacterium]|uniref:Uncharacterized protein n=1 Tax=uncultured Chloroflexia bacterium TaxID=1672391 RepID=A0A6J4HEE8_9CHLR|nr:MAG: hypothetical protein AVDCRST_MAG26-534 [uncultured Chloroflexia bacterium]
MYGRAGIELPAHQNAGHIIARALRTSAHSHPRLPGEGGSKYRYVA